MREMKQKIERCNKMCQYEGLVKDLYVYLIVLFPEAMRYADITVTRTENSKGTKDIKHTKLTAIGNSVSYSIIAQRKLPSLYGCLSFSGTHDINTILVLLPKQTK